MITLIRYNKSDYIRETELSVEQSKERLIDSSHITWLDIESQDKDLLQEMIDSFGYHPLILDDILGLDQLPKFEVFDQYIYFSANMLSWNGDQQIGQEKISITLNENNLITFQEGLPGDVFDELRLKIENGVGLMRSNPVDYLFYQVLNAIVGGYNKLSAQIRLQIEELEDKVLAEPNYDVIKDVIDIKRSVNIIRRNSMPLLDAVMSMKTDGVQFLSKANKAYLHDLHDQIKSIVAFSDTSREILRDVMAMHQTNQNNEMNRVMKTLTIVSAIFIPMTFIAGIYGMNFDIMPELHWAYGYFSVLGLMIIIGGLMFYILKRKKWL